MDVPKVFISYSHDSLEHKKWVLELAIRLRNNGIDAIIDQFELKAGDDVPHFMESQLAQADKILMICTERYVQKANKGEGGVGYEKMIVTSNLLKRIDENKIIPIIRQHGETDLPTFLKSKLYISFSKDDDFEVNYDNLVRTIHNTPLFEKPEIGNNPFKKIEEIQLNGDVKLLHDTLSKVISKQGISSAVRSDIVAYNLKLSESMFRVIGTKLQKLGYTRWVMGTINISVTEKGLLYAYDNGLIE